MQRCLAGSCCLLLSILFLTPTSHYAQNTDQPDRTRSWVAINLLRAINTAEVTYKLTQGQYVSWDTLVSNGDFTDKGSKWLSKDNPKTANLQFSKGPQALPGWALRLNVSANGKAYDLLLEDTTDNKCGYAALTDERGVIRQSKAIDCEL